MLYLLAQDICVNEYKFRELKSCSINFMIYDDVPSREKYYNYIIKDRGN